MSEFNGDQECNPAGRQIIESSEQFYEKAYQDSGGVWTIGFGHTTGVSMNTPSCTLTQADIWLEEDLKTAEDEINNSIRYQLNINQFSALCSLVFNIGSGNWSHSSVLEMINSGNISAVPAHIELWNKDHKGNILGGLVKRRLKEVALWLTPMDDSNDVANT